MVTIYMSQLFSSFRNCISKNGNLKCLCLLKQVGLKYSKKYTVEFVRVLTLTKNRGKGGAIRLGMLSARGRALLFADADGATEFKDLVKLEESLKKVNKNQVRNGRNNDIKKTLLIPVICMQIQVCMPMCVCVTVAR